MDYLEISTRIKNSYEKYKLKIVFFSLFTVSIFSSLMIIDLYKLPLLWSALVVSCLISFLHFFLLNIFYLRPMKKLAFIMHQFFPTYTRRLAKTSVVQAQSVEVREIIASFESLQAKYNRQLSLDEEKINFLKEEKTLILRNIPVGIMMIRSDLLIDESYSPQLEDILERGNLKGHDCFEVLFSESTLPSQKLKRHFSSLMNSFGVSRTQFDKYSLDFIRLFQRKRKKMSNSLTTLELKWIPILDEYDVVERVLIVIHDITMEKRREREWSFQKKVDLFIQESTGSPVVLESILSEIKESFKKEKNNLFAAENVSREQIFNSYTFVMKMRKMAQKYTLIELVRQFMNLEGHLNLILSGKLTLKDSKLLTLFYHLESILEEEASIVRILKHRIE